MLAASPSVAYIHEPFNIHHDVGECRAGFEYWFTYVNDRNEGQYYEDVRRTLNYQYNLVDKLAQCRQPKVIVKSLVRYLEFAVCRLTGKRALLKDPIALFSAEWLASRFDVQPVVMIRHPAAFAGSLKVKDWRYPFSHLREQSLLMDAHLQSFKAEIDEFVASEKDIVEQAALLWSMIHFVIQKYKRLHPDWIYVRHEDLSRDPVNGFRTLFEQLDLDFPKRMVEQIEKHSFAAKESGIRRDSAENVHAWKKRLSASEIDMIRARVSHISDEFYSADEW